MCIGVRALLYQKETKMYGEPPEPPEWVIDLQIFEDNVKKGFARIVADIAKSEKDLEELRVIIHRPGATPQDFRRFTECEARLIGLCRAQQHLIDTMGGEDSFKDKYWSEHYDEE